MTKEYGEESRLPSFTLRQGFGVVAAICIVIMISLAWKIVETVSADEIVVIQSPFTGSLTWYTTPGPKLQLFGKVTRYKKRSIYEFHNKVRFNDGGHATMEGSIQYDLPTDESHLNLIHGKYGSQDGVQNQLIATVVDKCTYMTGPTMSSQESYAAKRNLLIWYVEDQVSKGVYKTRLAEKTVKDAITGEEKTVTAAEIEVDPNTLEPARIEKPVLEDFGVKPFNFSIKQLPYDDVVEKQIQTQQQATMDVQIAIAEAKKAEQRKLTVEAEGAATAAKSKWEQMAIKEKEITRAEQEKSVAETDAKKRLAVAELAAQEAEQYKRSQILRAEGDAQYKERVMKADGALAQKLEALITINGRYAEAIEKHPGSWVPTIVMGSNGTIPGAASSVTSLVDMLTAQTAKQLALDVSVTGQQK